MKNALFGLALATAFAAPAQAVEVVWADWTSATSTTATGTLATSTPISIEFSSPSGFGFVQTGTGTNYWTEPNAAARPYTGGVEENAPPAAELIALSSAGTKTIKFGEAISGLYLAIISWNGNAASFDQPFTVISQGQGYWGNGSITLGAGNTFVASGEPHGIIYFPGTFSSLTFTDTSNEYWHGLTIGVEMLASEVPGGVPEPTTWAMMIAGFGLVGTALRRRPRVSTAFA
jgi:hypothetical protein